MKVLHVIPSISPLRGGPSKAALEMVAALRQAGVDASLITTNDHGPGLLKDLPTGRWQIHRQVPVLALPRWSPPVPALREFAVSPGMSRWLGSHIHDYDLLHVHALFSYPSTAAMVQARRAGVPYLLRTIGQLSRWSLAQSARRKRWMLRLVERANLEGAAALHFTTALERSEAADLGLPTPSLVLPLGVHLPPLPQEPQEPAGGQPGQRGRNPEEPIRFLFLSRLHPKKRLEHLLEACALLQERLPRGRWQLAIAGSGEEAYVASLRQRAARLGIEARCRWLGQLEGEAKWDALRQADWFVLPSAAENFGIAVVESLAAGTPVIVSPQVAVAETVQAAGAGLVCPGEPELLASTLERAMRGSPPAMRAAARNLAQQHYGWSSLAQRLAETYQQILSDRAQR